MLTPQLRLRNKKTQVGHLRFLLTLKEPPAEIQTPQETAIIKVSLNQQECGLLIQPTGLLKIPQR
jgi:hypothetical protein